MQEQIEESEILGEEQKEKAREIEEKDKTIINYSNEIVELTAELEYTRKLLEKKNHTIQKLRNENKRLLKEQQENTKRLERIEEKANDTLIEKKHIENSTTST